MSVRTRPGPVAQSQAHRTITAPCLAAVIRRGVRDQRRAVLAWGGSLGAMGTVEAAMWPSIESSMSDLMRRYPQPLKDAFNIRTIASVEAYVDVEMLSLILPLAMAFLAVRVVARALCTAEERGYLDTILATPLPRGVLVAGTWAIASLTVAAVLGVVLLLTWVAGAVAGADPSASVLARGMANVWPLSMFFAGLATLAAGRVHRAAPVTAIATGTLVAMYVIDLVGRMAPTLRPLRWGSAFRYYGSAIRDGIDPVAFGGLALTGLALAAIGAFLFSRRDIR